METRLLWEHDAKLYREGIYMDVRSEAIAEGCIIPPPQMAMSARGAEGTLVWGAIDDDRLVGVVALSMRSTDVLATYAWLWGLYVRPRYRGTPASRFLMEATLKTVEGCPIDTRLFAAFDAGNYRAARFFSRWGFLGCDQEARIWSILRMRAEDVLVERHRAGKTSLGGDAPQIAMRRRR